MVQRNSAPIRQRRIADRLEVAGSGRFVGRSHRTAFDEFFRMAFRTTFDDAVEALQRDFDQWPVHYNTERPHLGYRTMGERPIETVEAFVDARQPLPLEA